MFSPAILQNRSKRCDIAATLHTLLWIRLIQHYVFSLFRVSSLSHSKIRGRYRHVEILMCPWKKFLRTSIVQHCNAVKYTGFIRGRIEWTYGIGELTEKKFYQEAKGTWGWTSHAAFTPTRFGRLGMVARRLAELRVAGKGFHPRPKRTAMLGRLLVRCFLRDEHGWLCVDISVHVTNILLWVNIIRWFLWVTRIIIEPINYSFAFVVISTKCGMFVFFKSSYGEHSKNETLAEIVQSRLSLEFVRTLTNFEWRSSVSMMIWKLKTDLWLNIDEPWECKVRLYDCETDKVETYSSEHSISPHMFSNTRHQNVLPRKLVILRSAFRTPS